MQLSYCHLFGWQTVRIEQRSVVDSICYLVRDSSMAEAILFDTLDRGLLKMSAARDKWALTSGVLNQWCEKGTTKIRTNPVRCRSQYYCWLRGHQLSRECTDMSSSIAAIVMQPFVLTSRESLSKSQRATCSNCAVVSLFGILSARRGRWRREGHWSSWWGHHQRRSWRERRGQDGWWLHSKKMQHNPGWGLIGKRQDRSDHTQSAAHYVLSTLFEKRVK